MPVGKISASSALRADDNDDDDEDDEGIIAAELEEIEDPDSLPEITDAEDAKFDAGTSENEEEDSEKKRQKFEALRRKQNPFDMFSIWNIYVYLFKTFGYRFGIFLLVYTLSGFLLRQVASWLPVIASLLFSGEVPPPTLAERFLVGLLSWTLSICMHAVLGILAMICIAIAIFVYRDYGKENSDNLDLAQRYGQNSWAAVVMAPNDPLGKAFCTEMADANLNLVVVAEGDMQDFCNSLQECYEIQVQPFQMQLNDADRIANVWKKFDIALVVFVMPLMPTPKELDFVSTEGETRMLESMAMGCLSVISAGASQIRGRKAPVLGDTDPPEQRGKARLKGGIVCATSVCGCFPVPGYAAQSATDAAALALADALAVELEGEQISVLSAPCTSPFVRDDPAKQRATAKSVLLALDAGAKISYGPWWNALQVWILRALTPQMRCWLFSRFWKQFLSVREKAQSGS